MTTKNSETNEPHKFVLIFSEDLRSSNKHVTHQNLPISYNGKI